MSAADIAKCSTELWQGKVAIELTLSESDITANEKPESVFLLPSRYSYLPIVCTEAVKFFQYSALEFSSDIWYESNGVPLKRFVET